MSLTLRRTATAAVLALAVSPLAACGDKTSGDASPAGASSTTSATTSAPSTPGGEPTTAGTDGGQVDPSEFLAAYQNALAKATTSHLMMTISGKTALTATGEADYSTSPPSIALALKGLGSSRTQVIIAGGAVYISSAQLGGKFLKADITQVLGTGGTDFFDPQAMLPILKKGITAVTHVGTEDVAGESLDHYSVTIDGKTLEAALPGGLGGASSQTGSLPSTLTEEVYFDGGGLLRKMVVAMGASLGSATVEYDHWGEPVSITAPSPSQIEQLPG